MLGTDPIKRMRTQRIRGHPHFFQLIEFAHFGTENMNDHVICVDEHPIAGFLTLDPRGSTGLLFEPFNKLFGDRGHLPR